jgi:hypothetical protein
MKGFGSSRAIVLAAAFALLAGAEPAQAQRQTASQADCLVALHKAGGKVSQVTGKRLTTCVSDAAKGSLDTGQTASTCVASDDAGKLADALTKVESAEDSSCPTAPSFGAASAASINAAYPFLMPIEDVFGADLDAAILEEGSDPAGAECQEAIARSLTSLMKARLKEYRRCLRDGLREATLLDAIALSTCYDADPRAKLSRAVEKASEKIAAACATTSISSAAPGDCASSGPDDLAECLDRELSCLECEQLGAADDVEGLCDLYDDNSVNGTCMFPARPPFSVARLWDGALLEAIRRDTPRPTVHARNLFHLSVAMWDAWVSYKGSGTSYIATEIPTPADVDAELDEALSHAAYRLLSHRFATSVAAFTAQANFDYWMRVLGYDPDDDTTAGSSPAAIGHRIGDAVIAYGLGDGSNESGKYVDNITGYTPLNAPMIVAIAGTTMVDPNHWQPLSLSVTLAQNGTPIPSNTQTFLGSHWGDVLPFALTRPTPQDVYDDPGDPPYLGGAGDAQFKSSVLDVIRRSSYLDGADLATTIDVSPGARGNNTLGTNDGTGHVLNPSTGLPYASNVVRRSDWVRSTAEFWADGPDSETPPGHWNTLANEITYEPGFERRIGGAGPVLDALEWDVKLYLALNGAVHDAAVACWDAKFKYDYVRPISMVRFMAGKGQSSDSMGPSYDPLGLPLEAGLVEVITPASTADGERHEHLAAFEGEIAIRAWAGSPDDRVHQIGGVVWMRGVEWVPYQLPTFVTPAFAAYTSGHSTFSRAAAEVLAAMTGSEFFPGGLKEEHRPVGSLRNESGPSNEVVLQWATYYDAADDAGLSRLFGGIHVQADDFGGRSMGALVGVDAYALAEQYWNGTVP